MYKRIPQHIIDELTGKLDIVDLVSDYVQLKPKGNRLWGLSPFKTEKTPSFSVDPDKQLYYCFSTQQGGTAIQFFMAMEGLTFPEAVIKLAERSGIQIEAKELSEQEKAYAALLELYQRVANSFHHIFMKSPGADAARTYMIKRGFQQSTIEDFFVGYCPDDPFWLYEFLRSKGYSDKLLSGSGLFTKKNPKRALFNGRIIFPIWNEAGRIVAFGGRSLSEDGPKYINSPETQLYSKSSILYGFWQARQHIRSRKQYILVEGYMDLLAMHQAGFPNTVAPLGTAFTNDQLVLLSRFAREAVLLFDSDSAGYNAAYKAAVMCEQNSVSVKAVRMPPGTDPAELLQQGGLHSLQNSVSSPVHVLEYLYSHISSQNSSGSVGAVSSIIRELSPYLSAVSSAVQKEASYAFLGERLGIDPSAIKSDMRKSSVSSDKLLTKRKEIHKEDGNQQKKQKSSLEMFLMISSVANIELFPFIRKKIELNDLLDEDAQELFVALEEVYRSGSMTSAAVIEHIEDMDLRSHVLEKVSGSEFVFADDMPIKEAMQRLRERNVRSRKNFLQQELRSIRGTDIESIDHQKEIMAELMHLDTILRDVRESADE